jgi:hypothetical protein
MFRESEQPASQKTGGWRQEIPKFNHSQCVVEPAKNQLNSEIISLLLEVLSVQRMAKSKFCCELSPSTSRFWLQLREAVHDD